MHTIGLGSVEGRSIFMDESTDSYFTIDPALEADVETVVESGGLVGPAHRLHTALGLADEVVKIVRPAFALPTGSLLEELRPSSFQLADVPKAALLLFDMRRKLRSQPIRLLLAHAFPNDCEPITDDDLIDRVSRFLSARRLVPIKRNCLLDSMSLARWLGGNRVSILFGVKLNPFAAHCWLQSGPLILNDLTENVAAFTVVRAV